MARISDQVAGTLKAKIQCTADKGLSSISSNSAKGNRWLLDHNSTNGICQIPQLTQDLGSYLWLLVRLQRYPPTLPPATVHPMVLHAYPIK